MKTMMMIGSVMAFALGFPVLAEDVKNTSSATASNVDNSSSAVADLCNTYADEDGIAASERPAYISKCLKGMTDLSEGMREGVPLVADATEEAVAAPSSTAVNSDPEQLIKNELVEIPDPAAEQLDAQKK